MSLSGATRAEIESHYDRGDEFYRLWLGDERVYSCAMWSEGALTLDAAQMRKLRFHLDNLRLAPASRVLDIGCGWGALLRRAREEYSVERAVGLTLSEAQWRACCDQPHTDVRLENWTAHEPEQPYDGV